MERTGEISSETEVLRDFGICEKCKYYGMFTLLMYGCGDRHLYHCGNDNKYTSSIEEYERLECDMDTCPMYAEHLVSFMGKTDATA